MTVNPYLHFKGNCAEAIAFYEKSFGVKAKDVAKFSDIPQGEGYKAEPGTENYITHACLPLGEGEHSIFMSDWLEAEKGRNISISVAFSSMDEAKKAFDKLAAGGEVEEPLSRTFWAEAWGSLTDKFGIMWQVTV